MNYSNSQKSFRNGFTLIEALASTVLLALLMWAVLRTQLDCMRQHEKAAAIHQATQLADTLLSEWQDSQFWPRGEKGQIESFRWQTSVVSDHKSIGVQVLRLELWRFLEADSSPAICSIDVLIPTVEEE